MQVTQELVNLALDKFWEVVDAEACQHAPVPVAGDPKKYADFRYDAEAIITHYVYHNINVKAGR